MWADGRQLAGRFATLATFIKRKGVASGARKGDGQSSAGEERTMDNAGVYWRKAILSVDKDEGQGKSGAIPAAVLGSARIGRETVAAGRRVA